MHSGRRDTLRARIDQKICKSDNKTVARTDAAHITIL